MGYAPIALFVYCRPDHARITVEALLQNKESVETDLYIFSDAPKNEKAEDGVRETRKYIHTISGFKSVNIIEREKNWGLAPSLIDGITKIVNDYGRVIVIEDDIKVSEYSLQYFNDALEIYKDDEQMACIHAYVYPHKEKLPNTFLIKGADCWGWATWKRAWDEFVNDPIYLRDEIKRRGLVREFDFDYTYNYMSMLQNRIDGKNSSWAICWYASAFLKDMYTLYPDVAMAQQIGMDGVGATHSSVTNIYDVELATAPLIIEHKSTFLNNPEGLKSFKAFFFRSLTPKGHIIRLLKFLQLWDMVHFVWVAIFRKFI